MTLGPPTVHCYLDDGSGTYPTDISSRVDLSPDNGGLQLEGYGRADEFDYAGGTELTVVLNNTDGALTVGGTPISKRQGIRITLTKGSTTKNRFTGKIDGADLGWPGGLGKLANLAVTALDPIADCGNFTMRSMLEHEFLAAAPALYWPCGDGAGAIAASDVAGLAESMRQNEQAGTGAVFGTDLKLWDDSTGMTFGPDTTLTYSPQGQGVQTGTSFSLTFVFISTAGSAALSLFTIPKSAGGGATVDLQPTGTGGFISVGGTAPTGGANLHDGLPHVVTISASAISGDTWVDGVKTTFGGTAAMWVYDQLLMVVLGLAAGEGLTLGHVSIGPKDSDAAIAALHAAVMDGFAGETTDARFARLASYGGFSTTTTTGLSGQTLANQSTRGETLLTALQQVADSEIGVVYANGSGVLVLQGRGYRSSKVAADLTLAGTQQELGADTVVTLDDQQQLLLVTVTDATGASQTVGAGLPSKDLTVLDDNSGDALRTAQWLIVKHADPGPRLPAATLDPYTSSAAEHILQREVGDRLAFTTLPSQAWAFGDATIEGWSETITQDSWAISCNLLPWSLFTALVLDDPVYGALDAYPLMP